MNRKWKKTLAWVLSILILSILLNAMATERQISNKDLRNKYTSVEQNLLEDINPEFTNNLDVLELKKAGLLDKLVMDMDAAYKTEYKREMEDKFTMLKEWNLNPEMTVSQLKESAQEYLDKHYSGIQVDSVEFHGLVTEMFDGDSYPLAQMVKDDPSFGPLYFYMCIYYDENYNENLENPLLYSVELNSSDKTLKQVIEDDFNRNFQESTSVEVLQDVNDYYGAAELLVRWWWSHLSEPLEAFHLLLRFFRA